MVDQSEAQWVQSANWDYMEIVGQYKAPQRTRGKSHKRKMSWTKHFSERLHTS